MLEDPKIYLKTLKKNQKTFKKSEKTEIKQMNSLKRCVKSLQTWLYEISHICFVD